ncbi:MAG: class I SAM-dependent methyltransferase [Xanthomonadales bacterium]|nr:class I SAM-dependent methyltransferase [Xanthomonadales bacterium]
MSPAGARDGTAALQAALAAFFAQATPGDDPYLAVKTRPGAPLAELAQAWRKIESALAGSRSLLDFGCRHGVFAWLARRKLGAGLNLHGCDVVAPGPYAALHAASGMHYAALGHPWSLPYPDGSFDVVIAGGTLEHVAHQDHTLDELWRVLQPGGRLVLTHLPNAASWSEWLARRLHPAQAHHRRYRLAPLRHHLLARGFLPLRWGRHQMLPASGGRLADALFALNRPLEALWPLNRLATTLWLVAEKRLGF